MIWLIKNWRIALSGAALILIVGMAVTIRFQSADKRILEREKQTLVSERDEAIAVFKNYAATTQLFSEVSRDVRYEKQQVEQESETRVVYIREAVRRDSCADQLVPVAAANALRVHADKIRSVADGADPH
ncbi:hypothetical protein J0B02_10905 [Enterobacteriaceae bacterium YMB-R22]|uniref:DUF2570 domain-containing protein n=1 Tax=Mixta intestinalis TaxID=1615494 RepID=A0A6P1PXE3_9GAMM|nr:MULTISPECIES: hypothetical protein [Enterobacterales]MBV4413323.1 hypothetical protein [Tenebrionicola larvae]QHM70704.1 hypothetical protein C7M51_00982 [Mixta intestinalis]